MSCAPHPPMLGPLGGLRGVPHLRFPYQVEPGQVTVAHQLLSGRRRVDRAPRSSRVFNPVWPVLSTVETEWLNRCASGYVPGPLLWVDPTEVNQLPPSTSTVSSLAGWVQSEGSLVRVVGGSQGMGAAIWAPTVAASLAVGPAVPVLPAPYDRWTGSVWVSGSGQVQVDVAWSDSAGADLPGGVGRGQVVVLSGQPWRLAVSAVAPKGAAAGRLMVSSSGAAVVTLDGPQVEWRLLSDFVTGPGLARVAAINPLRQMLMPDRWSMSLTLQEVTG